MAHMLVLGQIPNDNRFRASKVQGVHKNDRIKFATLRLLYPTASICGIYPERYTKDHKRYIPSRKISSDLSSCPGRLEARTMENFSCPHNYHSLLPFDGLSQQDVCRCRCVMSSVTLFV